MVHNLEFKCPTSPLLKLKRLRRGKESTKVSNTERNMNEKTESERKKPFAYTAEGYGQSIID